MLGLFHKEFRRKLEELRLELLLDERYVDDKNMAARAVPFNMDVVEKEGVVKLVEVREVEMRERVHEDAHTAKVFRKVADSIRPKSIKMTEDYPTKYGDSMMPIFDMLCGVFDISGEVQEVQGAAAGGGSEGGEGGEPRLHRGVTDF